MKIANVMFDGKKYLGIFEKNRFYPFSNCIKVKDIYDLIENYSLDELLIISKLIINKGIFFNVNEIEFLSPYDYYRENVLCLGLNYEKHVEESKRYKLEKEDKPTNPVFFSKRVAVVTGNNSAINGHFDIVDSLDYECELAVIIAKDTYKADKKNYIDSIFGFSIANDVSARNIQTKHVQWHLGKSLDTFCPLGPYIVTRDEFTFPLELNVKTRINGEIRQNDNTRNFIHKLDEILATLSEGMTLRCGSVILTGTPSGVGMGMIPPTFLKPGDKIECEIEKIGILHNFVI